VPGLAGALITVALGACNDGAGKPHTGSAEQYYEIALRSARWRSRREPPR
jgi:hypothetical protein